MHRHKFVLENTSKPCKTCRETTQANWRCAVPGCSKTQRGKIACRCKR